jgi:hypothetical protein
MAEEVAAPAPEASMPPPDPKPASVNDSLEKAFDKVGFDDDAVDMPKPLSDETDDDPAPEQKAEPEKKPEKKAEEKPKPKEKPDEEVQKADDDNKPEPKAKDEEGADLPDGEDAEQKAANADDTTTVEAPDRFHSEAKEEWANTPEPVQHEVQRALDEMGQGLEKYRGDAEAYQEFSEFHQLLQAQGQKFEDVVGHYVGIENLLSQNPLAGMDRIAQNMGMSLPQIASQVLGVPLEQREQQYLGQMKQMNQTIQMLNGEVTRMKAEREAEFFAEAENELKAFNDAHPRMADENFAKEVAFFYTSEKAATLDEAYEMAERMMPDGNKPKPKPKAEEKPVPTAQTQRGRSLNGAPKRGSNPRKKAGAVPSTRDALKQRFGEAGL